MRSKTLDELEGYEILAKPIMAEDFCIVLPEGAVLKPGYIKKLRELEIQKVYIKEDTEEESVLILKTEMENAVKEKIKEILGHHTYQHNAELMELCETADNIIVSIVQEDEVAEQVFDVKERSADIYEHSLSICTLAVLTALKMNMPQNIVHDIGVGCLLHDIGLRYLAMEYTDENLSTLSEEDMGEYKKHPVYGYSALKDETWISDVSKSIILYHHERLDGSGYPLRASSLTEAIQIVAVCDTFDEMICGIGCDRVKVHEAVEYLKTFKNLKFGATIVDTFLKFIAVYPTGSRVLTNEGEEGIVIRQNKEFPDRPVIRIITDKNGRKIAQDLLKDLIKIHHVFIEKTLDD
ncbi:MAG: HD domain-containing protein [Lachnospiraceae bacterium]|nr:HD domain-containing protein [Lachnospiraceae bacterium]